MTLSNFDRLLIKVLNTQDEDGRGADLSEERARAICCGDKMHQGEKYLLVTSPLARKTYRRVWENVQIEREACHRRWERAGVQTTTAVLAAAASEQYPIEIPGKSGDFRVIVRPHSMSQGWIITLSLGESFRRNVRNDEILAVFDDRRAVWVRGTVNSYGEIHSYDWSYKETPWERIRQQGFGLTVEHA
jgi:hypothetical protein